MRGSLMLGAAAAAFAALAGCGSSSKSTSSTGASSASTTSSAAGGSAAAATTSPYGSHSPSGAGASTTAGAASAVSLTTKHAALGTVLAVGPKRMTVYMFEADKGSASACSASCAAVWPPVTTTGAATAAGAAISSHLATITRPDGTKQVTYNGHPLYRFAKDKDKGDSYGQGVKAFGASWYVLAPSGKKIDNS
jgi:predicted lipoprotein with Yx(FWY)xxD motif